MDFLIGFARFLAALFTGTPQHVGMMPDRVLRLGQLTAGLERTGVPFVGWDGARLFAVYLEGAPGSFYVIPRLAVALDISATAAIDLFYATLMAVAFALGAGGLLLLVRTWPGRAVALLGLILLCLIGLYVGDQYSASVAVTVATVPLFLASLQRRAPALLFAASAYCGIVAGFGNTFRIHLGTGVLVFALVGLLFAPGISRRLRALVVAAALLASLLPGLALDGLVRARDRYLRSEMPAYRVETTAQTPIWHSIYIGLGAVDNPYGISYRDEIAYRRVLEIAPGTPYVSPQYSPILRREVFRLVREDPGFVIRALSYKALVTAVYLVLFANVGLLLAIRHHKPRHVEAAFWLAIAFTALPAILVMPYIPYLLGMASFATLYGLLTIDQALHAATLRRRAARVGAPASADAFAPGAP